MAREAYDDYKRHLNDKRENNSLFNRLLHVNNKVTPINHPLVSINSPLLSCWELVKCKHLKVGNIVKINQNEFIPADLVLLHSSLPDGACLVDTSNLDGESNLKQLVSLPCTTEFLSDPDSIHNISGF